MLAKLSSAGISLKFPVKLADIALNINITSFKGAKMLIQTTKPKYIFFCDPGHAWLRVKRCELTELGIAGDISSFSYQMGIYVYLEEDCDASVFLRAKYGKDISFRELESLGVIQDKHANGTSAIRGYDHYQA